MIERLLEANEYKSPELEIIYFESILCADALLLSSTDYDGDEEKVNFGDL